MVIRHEPINTTTFLNHHPFVREKLNYLHNLVVIKFRSCQFVGSGQFFFQSLISRNSFSSLKSLFESLAMDCFVDVPIRGEGFLFGTTYAFLGWHIVCRSSGSDWSLMQKANGRKSLERVCTLSTLLMLLSSLSFSIWMTVSALLLISVPMCPRAFSSLLF